MVREVKNIVNVNVNINININVNDNVKFQHHRIVAVYELTRSASLNE